jgi:signal transduction histidine kinase
MTPRSLDKIEECVQILSHEIEKLDELGQTFAASLVRIAHLDLQMQLHDATEEDIDVLSFVEHALEKERLARRREKIAMRDDDTPDGPKGG